MSIDNALHMADTIVLSDDSDYHSFSYEGMRQCLAAALEKAKVLDEREPQMALEWALLHLPPESVIESGIIVEVNPVRRDPRMTPFCSLRGRAQWLIDTQSERLTAASATLRTANERALEAREGIGAPMEPPAPAPMRIKADDITSIKYEVGEDGLRVAIGHAGGLVEHTFPPAQDGMTKQASLVLLLLESGGKVSMAEVANSLYAEERGRGELSATFPKTIGALCRDTCRAIGADVVCFSKSGTKGTVTLATGEICDMDKRREEQDTHFGTIQHRED